VAIQRDVGKAARRTGAFAAPPVYRPCESPKIVQGRIGLTRPPQNAQSRSEVAAPPVYIPRPLLVGSPLTHLAQMKPKDVRGRPAGKPGGAPPVYRPYESPKIVQGRIGLTRASQIVQARPEQTAAPVYTPPPSLRPPLGHPAQMKRNEVAGPRAGQPGVLAPNSPRAPLQNVVQRAVQGITTFGELLNQFSNEAYEPFRGALTGNKTLRDDIIDLLDSATDYPMAEVWRRIVQRGYRHHWSIGNCNGDIWWSPAENAADLHVTGAIGASLSSDVLVERLEYFLFIFSKVQANGGPEGELQFHPTGAVVTKQLITALAKACGSPFDLLYPGALMLKRKKLGRKVVRNKLAPKIDDDLLPEYFGFLGALRSVPGIRIIPTGGGLSPPPGIADMTGPAQVDALNRNMLEDSPQGKERFTAYQKAYKESEEDMVPSMQVFVKARHIPALLKVISEVIG
jgi:hypothetical protein